MHDKVHPNEKGTKIMARVIARKICPHRKFPFPPEKKINVVFVGNSITEATYLKITPPERTTVYLDSLGYDVQSVIVEKVVILLLISFLARMVLNM